MLRNIFKIYSINPLRFYATAVPAKKLKVNLKESPLITCKRPELNLYPHQVTEDVIKFGTIPLASNGWKHRKSKNDFFIIHPTIDEETVFSKLNDISILKTYKINDIFIENLQHKLEIEKLTEIQNLSITKLMEKNHVLIAAETGCGKTLAYLLPIMNQILNMKMRTNDTQSMNTPFALILTPGRELASQIGNVAEKLATNTGLKIKTILGGNTKQKMMNPDFENVDILIGTIGATSKLVTTGIFRMGEVKYVVLDEADTLLDDSFSDKLCHFLKKFPFHNLNTKPDGTQLVLASATMPTNIKELLSKVIDTSTIQEVVSSNLHKIMPHVKQKFLRMNKSDRPSHLLRLVKSELQKQRPIIIFGNKSQNSDFVSIFLNDNGVNCLNLNGDMLMKIRIGRFEQYQRGDVDVLATTDVASRGLDTTRARHVINFDFPLHISDYIHRCGRIGRMGGIRNCVVTNFISSQREIYTVQGIEHAARTSGMLPNVNANITNLIHERILKELKDHEKKVEIF